MKISLAAVCVLVLAAFCYEGLAAPAGIPSKCCFSYAVRKVPQSHVQRYFVTSSQCPRPAVIFITRKGHEVCADPKQSWVQGYVNDLNQN
ncbi:C-C motif chemokine 4 homolog [Ambystoma mexicanum]|uniref:C-C motif chemokine 4 homolog n=1 Tax=Ambystoma mexicanum TaxID=8296 RepID=UPI0037E8AF8F